MHSATYIKAKYIIIKSVARRTLSITVASNGRGVMVMRVSTLSSKTFQTLKSFETTYYKCIPLCIFICFELCFTASYVLTSNFLLGTIFSQDFVNIGTTF